MIGRPVGGSKLLPSTFCLRTVRVKGLGMMPRTIVIQLQTGKLNKDHDVSSNGSPNCRKVVREAIITKKVTQGVEIMMIIVFS